MGNDNELLDTGCLLRHPFGSDPATTGKTCQFKGVIWDEYLLLRSFCS